jgi:CDP-diacylglycerol--serine O-phosphatidyltransferase
MNRKRQFAPNLLTIFNLFFGFLAIVSATQERFVTAAWLIIIAAVCDMLDGKIARATRSYSPFGIEFDSLADVVSFGAAPAILIYLAQLGQLGLLGSVMSFLPLAAGAIRLARFNTHTKGFTKSNYFEGMPIPASATLICSYVLFSDYLWEGLRFPAFTILLLLIASVLMISTIEFDAMPQFSFRRGKKNTVLMLLFFAATVTVFVFPGKVMFPLALFYIFVQLSRAVIQHLRQDEEEPVPDISVSKN